MTRQLRTTLSGLFLLFALAGVHQVQAQNTPPPTNLPPQPVMDQMTNIPYFTLRDGMSSTLTLQNLAPTATAVTVTIFNTAGQAHVVDSITLDSHSFKEVQLADVAPQGFDSGNVEVAFNGTMMSVTCQVSVFSLKNRVSFDSREQDMMDFESTKLAGILSLPKGADGWLAVTNASKNKLIFELTAGSLKKTVALLPRETNLVKLNDDEHSSEVTLVKLQHSGLPGDLISTGYVLNLKDGYSSGFAMVDPGIMRSSRLAGAHFRVGRPSRGEGFPKDTRFSSPLLLANVGAKPVAAHVSVDYTLEDKHDSKESGEDAENKNNKTPDYTTRNVADVTIAPGDVERIELSDALGGVGQIAEAGVDIAYDAAPGSVIGQLTSVDQSGDYAFEVPIKDPEGMTEMMEGIYPWTLENGTATVVHLKNTTKETQEIGVLIRFAGGTYQPDLFELQPFQTVAVDIQKLKDSKKPDGLGHLIPSDATHGQVAWIQKTPYTVIGRAEGTDVAAGIAKSFSCLGYCCQYYDSWWYLSPDPMNSFVGLGGQFTATNPGTDCNGNSFIWYNVQGTATSWASNNTAVATVNSTGYAYCAAGPGFARVTGYFPARSYYLVPPYYTRCTYNTYSYQAPAPVNVNPPNHLVVVQDLTSQKAGCPATVTPPFVRQLAMNVVDVNGTPVPGTLAQESFSNYSGNTCPGGPAPPPAPCGNPFPTLAEFVDNIGVNTCNVPTSPLWCGYSLTDEWQWCGGATAGVPVNIGKLNDIVHSNQITINNNASPLTPGGNNVQSIKPGTAIYP